MIYAVFYNSSEKLEDIEQWHPDKLVEAHQALNVINEKAKEGGEQ